jgi:hypothetical protein
MILLCKKETKIISLGTGFFVQHRIVSAVKKVEFVSDSTLYMSIVLRRRWHNIIFLNVHASSEDKTDDLKVRLYEEIQQVFDHSPKYHMNILSGDLNAKVTIESIFKTTFGIESQHQDSKDNGVRIVNFAT